MSNQNEFYSPQIQTIKLNKNAKKVTIRIKEGFKRWVDEWENMSSATKTIHKFEKTVFFDKEVKALKNDSKDFINWRSWVISKLAIEGFSAKHSMNSYNGENEITSILFDFKNNVKYDKLGQVKGLYDEEEETPKRKPKSWEILPSWSKQPPKQLRPLGDWKSVKITGSLLFEINIIDERTDTYYESLEDYDKEKDQLEFVKVVLYLDLKDPKLRDKNSEFLLMSRELALITVRQLKNIMQSSISYKEKKKLIEQKSMEIKEESNIHRSILEEIEDINKDLEIEDDEITELRVKIEQINDNELRNDLLMVLDKINSTKDPIKKQTSLKKIKQIIEYSLKIKK